MNHFSTTKKTVLMTSVVPNPWNPNRQSKQMIEKGIQSVKEFGLMGAILVRELAGVYEILDGEHRYLYAKELGWTEIPVESLGEIDDNRAKVLTVMLNNLRGKDDIEKRAAIYESLSVGQLQLLPFTSEEIENEKNLFKFDFSQYETKDSDLPTDQMIEVLSFKFDKDEWTVVQEAISHANSCSQNPKQLFMLMVKEYLRKYGFLNGF